VGAVQLEAAGGEDVAVKGSGDRVCCVDTGSKDNEHVWTGPPRHADASMAAFSSIISSAVDSDGLYLTGG